MRIERYWFFHENSICLFARCGFEKCAHYKQVGQKFDELLDVVAYQKQLSVNSYQ